MPETIHHDKPVNKNCPTCGCWNCVCTTIEKAYYDRCIKRIKATLKDLRNLKNRHREADDQYSWHVVDDEVTIWEQSLAILKEELTK